MKDIIITLIYVGFWIYIGFAFAAADFIEDDENTEKKVFIVISGIGFLMMITCLITLFFIV